MGSWSGGVEGGGAEGEAGVGEWGEGHLGCLKVGDVLNWERVRLGEEHVK